MGAVPESQIKAFIDRLAQSAGGGGEPSQVDELLAHAKESLDLNDVGGAAQAFAQVLQAEPDNLAAIGGLARCYLAGGDVERAGEIVAMAPPDAKNPDLDSVRAALALANSAPSDVGAFEHRLAQDPDDHDARLELANALAGRGKLQEAVDQLMRIVERDRDWNDGAARKQLLTVFEAAGPASEVARQGRRRLSAVLFS
jgi:putative thioredoxin